VLFQQWHSRYQNNLICYSVGIEDTADLIADLAAALERA